MSQRSSEARPTVLVTGSSGLIGGRICADLSRDYDVVGLDLDPPSDDESAESTEWIDCDLTDDASVAAAFERVRERHGPRLASVVHLAAYYDFSGEPSPLYDELTVEGTRRLLRALREFDVDQFVFSSSALVMKPSEMGATIDETSPVEAAWDYPRSKLDAESVIEQERGDSAAVVLRIAGVYDEDGHSIPLAQQMKRIYEKELESYLFPGNPDHGQPFVHLDDLVACFRAAVDRRASLADHEVFLIGEPDLVSYGELQDIIGTAIHGTDWPTIRIPELLAKAGAWLKEKAPGEDPFIKPWMVELADAHVPIAIGRAEAKLHWRPRRSLRATLPEMARRLVEEPEAWYERNGIEPPDDLAKLRERTAEDARQRGASRG